MASSSNGSAPGSSAAQSQRVSVAIRMLKAARMYVRGWRSGLVSRVVPVGELVAEAVLTAEKIASMSRPIAMMVKESVNRSYETTLAEGIRFERRLFHSTFSTEDQKEGMAAFVEKRQPQFRNR